MQVQELRKRRALSATKQFNHVNHNLRAQCLRRISAKIIKIAKLPHIEELADEGVVACVVRQFVLHVFLHDAAKNR